MLAQIRAPHFCCGIVLSDEIVTNAAPIVRYMMGWSRDRVRDYCQTKSWRILIVQDNRLPAEKLSLAAGGGVGGCAPSWHYSRR